MHESDRLDVSLTRYEGQLILQVIYAYSHTQSPNEEVDDRLAGMVIKLLRALEHTATEEPERD